MDFGEGQANIMSIVATRANPAHYADEFMKALPEDKQKIVKGLQGVQVDIDKLLQEQCFALHKVMGEFEAKVKPFLARRAELVSGKAAPTDAEIAAAPVDTRLEGSDPTEDGGAELRTTRATTNAATVAAGEGLQGFWLEALRNHDAFEQVINTKDAEVMQDLVHVEAVHMAAPRLGFIVRYVFRASKFIKSATIVRTGPTKSLDTVSGPCPAHDETSKKLIEAGPAPMDEILAGLVVPEGGCVLAKCYYMEADPDGDQVATAIDGTDIVWGDADPTTRIEEKKQTKGKGSKKQVRIVKKEVDVPSFFRMFKKITPETTAAEQGEQDEGMGMDDEEEPFETDFERGRVMIGTIVPRAAEWFTRRATGADAGMDDDEEDEDGMMMDGQDGEGGPMPMGPDGQKPECKQQ